MKDLWKYRWKSLAIFWVFYALIMLTDGKIFFASMCGLIISLMIMSIISYTHEEKSLFIKIATCGILIMGSSSVVFIIYIMSVKL